MKTIKTILGITLISSVLFITSPAVAQTRDSSATTTTSTGRDTNDNHNDSGKWGLLGLVGLLGLMGLKRKDEVRNVRTDDRNNPSNRNV